MIALCKNEKCEKSQQCKRFLDQEGEEMLFKNICGEWNKYKWFWEVELSVVEVKEEQNINSQQEDN